MPYLTQRRKQELADPKAKLISAGDLTYEMMLAVLDPNPPLAIRLKSAINRYVPANPRYEHLAIVLGCLDSTRREFVRRTANPNSIVACALELFAEEFYNTVVAPYEDVKIKQNGDVFDG